MPPKIPTRLSALLGATVCAVLIFLPAAASAQVLYVGGFGDELAAYDAATGKPLEGFVPIKQGSYGIALKGSTLYSTNKAGVGTYDTATGAPINEHLITGLESPGFVSGLAVYGNTLFVANVYDGKVSAYDATTGVPVSMNFITELGRPFALLVVGEILYVSNVTADGGSTGGEDAGTVHAYHAATGKPLEGFRVIHADRPKGLLVVNNVLYVASTPHDHLSDVGKGVNTIGTYNAKTGATINASFAVLSGCTPRGMATLGNTLFFSNYLPCSVGTCDATTGKLIDGAFIKGRSNATGLILSASAP